MKKILGLDLGTNSIGWALVNEAESETEKSEILRVGVRVNPLTVDELTNFEKGKSITTNADRTLKRSARRNLQRFKLRRENLIKILIENNILSDSTLLSEAGNKSTFETYKLRARAVTEKISLEEFARVLLMINKKRGYKSSRKAKSQDEGQLIDGMEIAKHLYAQNQTPGQFVLGLLKEGKKYVPDFYRSDLLNELDRIWNFQRQFFPNILTDDFKVQIAGKGKTNTSKIFLGKYGLYTAENKGADKRQQSYLWRADALNKQLSAEELAFVICDLNGTITNSSGYLGAISDRSKELYFSKQTVGQYLMKQLEMDPNFSLRNKVFYRQDYLDEFNVLWETQAKFHSELTDELKSEIRDVVIFYQRRLKSQKGLISFCELENKQIVTETEGKRKTKTIGLRVCPKSSPLFQEFKIWQILNNLVVKQKRGGEARSLIQEEKEVLFAELSIKEKLTKDAALKILFKNHKELDLNFPVIEGNKTQFALFEAYQKIVEITGHDEYDFSSMDASETIELVRGVFDGLGYKTEFLTFNSNLEGKNLELQPFYKLWHLLYSFEGDNSKTGNEKLIEKIQNLTGLNKEAAIVISNISLQDDYGSLSTKAMRKILPYLKEGHEYSLACVYAGYRHSKSSLTKEEIEKKELRDKLEILPKNSLHNPVVEKILNQMVNVVNSVVENFGKPDEIRIELARELKKSSKEREDLTKAINKTTTEHEEIKQILNREFGFTHVSRNDIIRYKLYIELEPRGFKTLYSNTYLPREKLFSKEFDIEHIIPQSRLFDDSFSNKTLEARSINIEKGNETAYDYVQAKYGQEGADIYLETIEELFSAQKISRAKCNKLKMKGADIPDGFIARDLRDTQYIAKKAKSILEELVRNVISTTGSITDRLREDWQLIDLMQELNWNKYDKLGLTEIIENREGHKIRRIKDWTKRNDHRHHAMDALTIAFTKLSHIQYLNNLNARSDKSGSIYGIEQKELYRDDNGKIKFNPPIPLHEFRQEAKKHMENTLISIKAKNKVVTSNINITKKHNGLLKKAQLTPRGQLHLETVYGSMKQYHTQELKVGAAFNEELISKVAKKCYRDALLARLREFDNDPKKAFTGKNSLDKSPLWIDDLQTQKVPVKVKVVDTEIVYTIRKEVSPDLKIDKVIDAKVKAVLMARLKAFNGDSKKAFSNLDDNPIWLNEEKRIAIKRVTITGVSNAQALHDKKDKDGNLVLDEKGRKQPVDFVNTGNNHHVAVYRDENGNLQENVISFFEATARVTQGLPPINKDFNKELGWQFLFSMKQNEFFVFPNEQTGFNPNEIDLLNPDNYNLISPNLFRVQKFSFKNYVFRHHLETSVADFSSKLKEITWTDFRSTKGLDRIIKIRLNHLGQIVSVGEY